MISQEKLSFALAPLVIALAIGTSAEAQSVSKTPSHIKKPNFLIIVPDDQRPDTIGALGNRFIHTPNLDLLCKQGMTFTRAVAPFPLCVPSCAEILTGCPDRRSGRIVKRLRAAERLAKRCYDRLEIEEFDCTAGLHRTEPQRFAFMLNSLEFGYGFPHLVN